MKPATVWLRVSDTDPAEGLVREWLAKQLGRPEPEVHFERDAHSRPFLRPPLAHVDCNWSHSGGYLLAGFVERARIGVDIELIQPQRKVDEIASRYFTAAEQAWLERLNGRNKIRAFHRLWCCKEAILKAQGRGLSFGLDRLELLPNAQRRLQIQSMDKELGRVSGWQLEEWIPAAGFVAALAVKRA